jgi:hypothetical protein
MINNEKIRFSFLHFIFLFLPIITGIILFWLFKSLDFTSFCDGETIDQLKEGLARYIVQYKEALKEFDYMRDIMTEAKDRYDKKLYFLYDFRSELKADYICNILRKIKSIENNIKQTDSSFELSALDRRKYFENL